MLCRLLGRQLTLGQLGREAHDMEMLGGQSVKMSVGNSILICFSRRCRGEPLLEDGVH